MIIYITPVSCHENSSLRADTHKKSFFFSGGTTKGVGRVNPLTTKQKTTFFKNPAILAQKLGEKKKMSKSVSD